MDSRQRAHILVVEDNPADVRLLRTVGFDDGPDHKLHVATDGEQALNFLLRRAGHEEAPRPDLILLDLNLPVLSGWEVLEQMKQEEHLRAIPVIILSSSVSKHDVRRSYELQAACYIRKPFSLDEYSRTCLAIKSFWLNTVTFA